MTGELDFRAILVTPPILGMKKVRDSGMLAPNEFDQLENSRHSPTDSLVPRSGMTAIATVVDPVNGIGPVDGIFDAGDAGWRPEPPLPPPASAPPPSGTVPATPATTRIDFLAELSQGGAGWTLAAVADIKDANPATVMEVVTTPQNESEILFSIVAPAIADDQLISNLVLHLTPANTGTTIFTYPPCWLNGLYSYFSEWNRDGQTDAVEFTLNILRPGGGPWYGRDLKNATLKIGVYVVFNIGTDPRPKFSEAWLTYTT